MRSLDALLQPGPAPAPTQHRTAVVVRSDASGVWCAPLGADRRHPLGPCLGAHRRASRTATAGGTTHDHELGREQLPVGAQVLLLTTPDGPPWVLAHHEEGLSG